MPGFTITGWPICAICKKGVDRIDSSTDQRTMELVFRAHCHGQTETTRLSLLCVASKSGVEFTEAFNTPKLESE